MSASSDVIYLLQNGQLPENILKDHKRAVEMSLFIAGEMQTIFGEALNVTVEDCKLTIAESSDLTEKLKNTSTKFDIKLITCAIEDSKTFDDVLESLTIGLHHRSPREYADVIAKELAKKELPNTVWLELLNRHDSWYFRGFNQIEIIVIVKSFETAPNNEIIAAIINDYSKRTSYSFNILISAIMRTDLPEEDWKEIKSLSTRREAQKACDEKINQK
jgi:hypothetical protein